MSAFLKNQKNFYHSRWARLHARRGWYGPFCLLVGLGCAGGIIALGEVVVGLLAVLFVAAMAGFWARGRRAEATKTGQSRLEDALGAAFERGARATATTACIIVEIDNFRFVEQRLGRGPSDDMMTTVAARLMRAGGDNTVAAFLDRFTIALCPDAPTDLTEDWLAAMTRALEEATRRLIVVDDQEIHLHPMIGVCHSHDVPEPTPDAMIKAAWAALNESRQLNSPNIHRFSRQIQERQEERVALFSSVGTALKRGEIKPWFQPQMSMDGAENVGFESLARWQHPSKGLLLPETFMPALDDAKIASSLGEAIMFNSLGAMQKWDQAGLRVPVLGVNFTHCELQDRQLSERVKWHLDQFEIAPERLAIEILETVTTSSRNDTIRENIMAFKVMGCSIDLDDFGAGCSSIDAIRSFEVDRIKIDRSYVSGIDANPKQKEIIFALLSMVKMLGLVSLAEGVERESERKILAELGCMQMQGFLVSKAMPAEQAQGWMERRVSAA